MQPSAIQQQKQHLTQLIRGVLYSMMGHVGLPAILGRITAEHGSDDFGDFKGIIQGMLDSYSHERRMLETVNAILKGDIYRSLRELHARRQRGTRPKGESCCLCGNPFSDSAFLLADRHVGIALFACGHAFHGSCIARYRLCPLCHRTDARRPTALPATDLTETLADPMSRAHSQTIVCPTALYIFSSMYFSWPSNPSFPQGQHQVQNTNPEVLKDYLSRLDGFEKKREDSSKVRCVTHLLC